MHGGLHSFRNQRQYLRTVCSGSNGMMPHGCRQERSPLAGAGVESRGVRSPRCLDPSRPSGKCPGWVLGFKEPAGPDGIGTICLCLCRCGTCAAGTHIAAGRLCLIVSPATRLQAIGNDGMWGGVGLQFPAGPLPVGSAAGQSQTEQAEG